MAPGGALQLSSAPALWGGQCILRDIARNLHLNTFVPAARLQKREAWQPTVLSSTEVIMIRHRPVNFLVDQFTLQCTVRADLINRVL